MPAVYFFLVDVSMNAVHTGATAAACSAISQALSDFPVSLDGSFVCIDYYKTTCYQLLAEFYLYNVICSWFLWSTANVFFVCLMFALKFLSCNCYLSRTFFSLKQVWWITFWWITHLLMIMIDTGYQNRGLLDSWYEFMIHGSPYLFGWWIGNWVRS